MKYLLLILPFILILAINAFAQQGAAEKVYAELIASSSNKVVKGAPFSAEGVSESIQTLADGNRIARSTTTRMYRDSEGRFRREGTGGATGFAPAVATYGGLFSTHGFAETISIYDPVESIRYTLNPSSKTARRFNQTKIIGSGASLANVYVASEAVKLQTELKIAKGAISQNGQKAEVIVLGNTERSDKITKPEPLGTRNFEGVEAEGTRSVTTIAAGAIGNERPIEIVYERWYSKELDMVVYSRHYDPRFGEQIYRLVNINRSEPDPSLFVPPADYNVVSEQTTNKIKVNQTYNAAKPKQQ